MNQKMQEQFRRIVQEDPTLRQIFSDMEKSDRERIARKAREDPKAYKLARVFDGPHGASYRMYDAGVDGLGRRVYFCYSCWRNVAGYFLSWREVEGKKKTKRDRWAARRARWRARKLAERRAESFREKHKAAALARLPEAPAEVRELLDRAIGEK